MPEDLDALVVMRHEAHLHVLPHQSDQVRCVVVGAEHANTACAHDPCVLREQQVMQALRRHLRHRRRVTQPAVERRLAAERTVRARGVVDSDELREECHEGIESEQRIRPHPPQCPRSVRRMREARKFQQQQGLDALVETLDGTLEMRRVRRQRLRIDAERPGGGADGGGQKLLPAVPAKRYRQTANGSVRYSVRMAARRAASTLSWLGWPEIAQPHTAREKRSRNDVSHGLITWPSFNRTSTASWQ